MLLGSCIFNVHLCDKAAGESALEIYDIYVHFSAHMLQYTTAQKVQGLQE